MCPYVTISSKFQVGSKHFQFYIANIIHFFPLKACKYFTGPQYLQNPVHTLGFTYLFNNLKNSNQSVMSSISATLQLKKKSPFVATGWNKGLSGPAYGTFQVKVTQRPKEILNRQTMGKTNCTEVTVDFEGNNSS